MIRLECVPQSVPVRLDPLTKFEKRGPKYYLDSKDMLYMTMHFGHPFGVTSTRDREGVHLDLLEAHGVSLYHIIGSKDAAHDVLSPAALLGVLENLPKTTHELVILKQWFEDAFQPLVIVGGPYIELVECSL